jgi:hypothetical protein
MTLNHFLSTGWGKFTVIAAGLGTILAFAANAEKMRRYFFPTAEAVAVTVYSVDGEAIPRSSLVRLKVELRKVGPEKLSCSGEVRIEEPVATGSMTMEANEAFKTFELLFRPRSADPKKIAEGEFRVKCTNQQIPRDLPPTDWKRIRFTGDRPAASRAAP